MAKQSVLSYNLHSVFTAVKPKPVATSSHRLPFIAILKPQNVSN